MHYKKSSITWLKWCRGTQNITYTYTHTHKHTPWMSVSERGRYVHVHTHSNKEAAGALVLIASDTAVKSNLTWVTAQQFTEISQGQSLLKTWREMERKGWGGEGEDGRDPLCSWTSLEEIKNIYQWNLGRWTHSQLNGDKRQLMDDTKVYSKGHDIRFTTSDITHFPGSHDNHWRDYKNTYNTIKCKIFIHPSFFKNPHGFIFSVEHYRRNLEQCPSCSFHTTEGNGNHGCILSK